MNLSPWTKGSSRNPNIIFSVSKDNNIEAALLKATVESYLFFIFQNEDITWCKIINEQKYGTPFSISLKPPCSDKMWYKLYFLAYLGPKDVAYLCIVWSIFQYFNFLLAFFLIKAKS